MSYSITSKIKNAISNAFSTFIYIIVTIVVFILIVIIKVYSLEKIRNPVISKVLYVLGLFFVVPLLAVVVKEIIIKLKKLR